MSNDNVIIILDPIPWASVAFKLVGVIQASNERVVLLL